MVILSSNVSAIFLKNFQQNPDKGAPRSRASGLPLSSHSKMNTKLIRSQYYIILFFTTIRVTQWADYLEKSPFSCGSVLLAPRERKINKTQREATETEKFERKNLLGSFQKRIFVIQEWLFFMRKVSRRDQCENCEISRVANGKIDFSLVNL